MPVIGVPYELEFRLGLWLFYVILGFIIGLAGRMTMHPLGFPLSFWIRGAWLGAVTHFLMALLAHENISLLLQTSMFRWIGLSSAYWVVVDGIIIGVIIGYAAKRWAGEGDLPMR